MADFLVVLGIVAFVLACSGSSGPWTGYDRRPGHPSAVSILVFIYLGVAMFKPEWF